MYEGRDEICTREQFKLQKQAKRIKKKRIKQKKKRRVERREKRIKKIILQKHLKITLRKYGAKAPSLLPAGCRLTLNCSTNSSSYALFYTLKNLVDSRVRQEQKIDKLEEFFNISFLPTIISFLFFSNETSFKSFCNRKPDFYAHKHIHTRI